MYEKVTGLFVRSNVKKLEEREPGHGHRQSCSVGGHEQDAILSTPRRRRHDKQRSYTAPPIPM